MKRYGEALIDLVAEHALGGFVGVGEIRIAFAPVAHVREHGRQLAVRCSQLVQRIGLTKHFERRFQCLLTIRAHAFSTQSDDFELRCHVPIPSSIGSLRPP